MAKIMIVDDDPNIVAYLKDLFDENGYETCSANDGAQALVIAEEQMPDLVTLDIEMPMEWGPRFYRKMTQSEKLKNVPVIVISGLTGNKYAVPKAVASLTKPFDRKELLKIVKDTIG